ncbi:hypothetical protein EDB84DRAFT_1563090 [Lactarius hengduanensis]|nr:hypothetical protein EDB84DRAFT_1440381 [Lactarius hengduanensis]KAH9028513.1 hypothetical protein EDB84DRAFT_1563090 [Lactarius hengduanensis]
MAASNPPLELTLNTASVLQGLLLIPPANGRIVINFSGTVEGSKTVAMESASASAMETTLSRGGDSERESQVQDDGVNLATRTLRPRDATENQPADGPAATMSASGPAMETPLSRGESKYNPQVDGDNLATCSKRPRDTTEDQADEPVKRQARGDPEGSRLETTGPQYVPATQGELVELPPMPKSLYDELMASPIDPDDSATEPESSEDERDVRKKFLT